MKKLLMFVFLSVFSFSASADILFEPYFGLPFNGEIGDDDKMYGYKSASTYGARFGYQKLGLQIGADYRIFNTDFKVSGDDYEYQHNALYGFIGYQFPVMIRVYGGMALTGSASTESKNWEWDYTGISSTYLGFSYTGLPFIAINFEIVNYEWDKEKLKGFSRESSDAEGNHYLLSVSLPLNF